MVSRRLTARLKREAGSSTVSKGRNTARAAPLFNYPYMTFADSVTGILNEF